MPKEIFHEVVSQEMAFHHMPAMPDDIDRLTEIEEPIAPSETVELAHVRDEGRRAAERLRYIEDQGYDDAIMDPEERARLAHVRDEGEQARQRMVLGNARLGFKFAQRYVSPKLPKEECDQVALLGLSRAADDFDPEKGEFDNHAMTCMRKEFNYAVESQHLIRIPEKARRTKDKSELPEQPLSIDKMTTSDDTEHLVTSTFSSQIGLEVEEGGYVDTERAMLQNRLKERLSEALEAIEEPDRSIFLDRAASTAKAPPSFRELAERYKTTVGKVQNNYYRTLTRLQRNNPDLGDLYRDLDL